MPTAVQKWIMKNLNDMEFEGAYIQEKEKIEKMNRDVKAKGKKGKPIGFLCEPDNQKEQ